MLELVTWSFALPMIAIVSALELRWRSKCRAAILRRPATRLPTLLADALVRNPPASPPD